MTRQALVATVLAVLAVSLSADKGSGVTHTFAAVFLLLSMVFVWRSFYGMRIETK